MKTKNSKADENRKLYISELKAENKKLQYQLTKYEVKNDSLKNEVAALKKEIKSRPNWGEILDKANEMRKKSTDISE